MDDEELERSIEEMRIDKTNMQKEESDPISYFCDNSLKCRENPVKCNTQKWEWIFDALLNGKIILKRKPEGERMIMYLIVLQTKELHDDEKRLRKDD
jgi:hypothetical protein